MVTGGCEKVIQLNINNTEPRISIEAYIDQDEFGQVKITQSKDFYSADTIKLISNALVVLSDDIGNSEVLTEAAPGLYSGNEVIGHELVNYQLLVTINGKTYEAQSKMPVAVYIDSLSTEYNSRRFGSGYQVLCNFTDNPYVDNYYWLRYYQNGKYLNGTGEYSIMSDEMINGQSVGTTIRQKMFDLGDSVKVELISVDYPVYQYLNGLEELNSSGLNSSNPYNPKSNFDNNALGYFSARTLDIKTILVK